MHSRFLWVGPAADDDRGGMVLGGVVINFAQHGYMQPHNNSKIKSMYVLGHTIARQVVLTVLFLDGQNHTPLVTC